MKRRIWALLMTVMMITTMIPSSAFAGTKATATTETPTIATSSNDQIVNDSKDVTDKETQEDGAVKINKSIEGTDTENVFNITLDVTTTENLEEIPTSSDAAVVLVIDRSGSMDWDVKGNETDNDNEKRIKLAKDAAVSFIDSFAKDANGSKRMVQIVEFASNAERKTNANQPAADWQWEDVATIQGKQNAKEDITGVNGKSGKRVGGISDPTGGTNIEAGLQLAYNIIKTESEKGQNSKLAGISNVNVILLTDGCPTFHIPSNSTERNSTSKITGEVGGSDVPYYEDHTPVIDKNNNDKGIANDLKNLKVNGSNVSLYSIAFSTGDAPFYYAGNRGDWIWDDYNRGHWTTPTNYETMSVFEWLKSFCGENRTFKSSDADGLTLNFESIVKLIKLGAKAWQVNDPMPNNIIFNAEAIKTMNDGNNEFTYDEGNLHWDLKKSTPKIEEAEGATSYHYQMKYQVALDTTSNDFEENKPYETNGKTILDYYMFSQVNNGEEIPEEPKQVEFDVPTVKGHLYGNLNFKKTDEKGKGLKGAKFKLEGSAVGNNKEVSRAEPSAEDGTVSFDNIPSGTYKLTEEIAPDGYIKSNDEYTVVISYGELVSIKKGDKPIDLNNWVIKNNPSTTSIKVTKEWNDANNQDGKRPENVTVKLLANGQDTQKTVELNKGNDWTATFDGIPTGKTYTVEEVNVPDGYAASISETYDANKGYVITNTYSPEKIDLSVKKVWNDSNNQDGKRPEEIKVQLKAGETNVGKPVTLKEENNWTYQYEGLDKYKSGSQITYTVEEENVPEGYDKSITAMEGTSRGFIITNTHTPETIDIPVEKVWNDNNNQDGKRPPSITVKVSAGTFEETETIQANSEGKWAHTFTGLPKYKKGKLINYTVTEDKVDEYETAVKTVKTSGKVIITNTHTPEMVTISGTKTWDDNNNQDGKRPKEITINLLKNGKIINETKTVATKDWKWSFGELPKYENGSEILYTVQEVSVDGYSTSYAEGNIINTHTPGKTSVSVTKAWEDDGNRDGLRAKIVKVELYKNNEPTGQTVELKATNDWTSSFGNLDEYENGKEISYTVKEKTAVEGYKSVVSGDAKTGYVITNTHTPATIDVSGTKTWIDDNGNSGNRPASITIKLLGNGEVIKTERIGATKDWKWNFTDLPAKENGKDIMYTVVEDTVPGYSTTYDGYNVTNIIAQEKISVTGTKQWIAPAGTKFPEIKINLLRDGKATDKSVVLKNGETTYTFDGLDKYDLTDGHAYKYTVAEAKVDGYTSSVVGMNVTNRINQDKVDISGTKTWKDPEGTSHPSVTINLLRDGIKIKDVVLENGTTSYSFEGLDMYDLTDGHEYKYTLTEDSVEGYTSKADGYNFINTINAGKTTISGVKTWIAPEGTKVPAATIILTQDGKEYDSVKLENGTTSYSFDVPVYAEDGHKYEYAIKEAAVEGYTSKVNGTNVTNTIAQEKVSVEGTKTWKDPAGTEHPEVTIELLRDGEAIATTTIPAGGSHYSFTDLDKYDLANGHVYEYTVREQDVANYSASYDGYDITNTLDQKIVIVSGVKTWVVPEGTEVPDITINLLKNGEEVDEAVLKSGETAYAFEGLEQYNYAEDGTVTVNEYTITEDAVKGYTSKIDGYNITNTKDPEHAAPENTTKTGDDFNVFAFGAIGLTALLTAVVALFRRRETQK